MLLSYGLSGRAEKVTVAADTSGRSLRLFSVSAGIFAQVHLPQFVMVMRFLLMRHNSAFREGLWGVFYLHPTPATLHATLLLCILFISLLVSQTPRDAAPTYRLSPIHDALNFSLPSLHHITLIHPSRHPHAHASPRPSITKPNHSFPESFTLSYTHSVNLAPLGILYYPNTSFHPQEACQVLSLHTQPSTHALVLVLLSSRDALVVFSPLQPRISNPETFLTPFPPSCPFLSPNSVSLLPPRAPQRMIHNVCGLAGVRGRGEFVWLACVSLNVLQGSLESQEYFMGRTQPVATRRGPQRRRNGRE
ncbi:hypothetical protein E2C01_037508 [Portunus trituberculatus]|uniref:Uncharacterized protein n=1 Tax=Portunus trituberculatus TaxID=210409 RepID=A0A5B7FHA0_PORTR|nr:hypothetical protein [Portunus trituberculatus]